MQIIPTRHSKSILYVETVSLPRHCDRLFGLWHDIQHILDTSLDILVDFHYCEFLNHTGVAFLGGLARLIEHRGGRITFNWDTLDRKIHINLAQNGFLYDFGCDRYPWDGNSIPFRCDIHQNKPEVNDYLLNKWLGKGWVNISQALQHMIAGRVWEIYDNAFIHSASEIGVFSCGQHYHRQKQLHLTIIDFGVGIPSNVRSLPTNATMTSAEALKWAFLPGKSTVSQGISRGLGLHLIQEFIAANQGTLKIYSNDGVVSIKNGKIEYGTQPINFSGTFVNIEFQCDETYYCLESGIVSTEEPLF
ncbi:MAG: ATP-binding protein [Leptolyngbyaceae bacterium]|nr:ATP-binding protein [Leptolyngbyaceae bacterium]